MTTSDVERALRWGLSHNDGHPRVLAEEVQELREIRDRARRIIVAKDEQIEQLRRELAHHERTLAPLCPCDPNPSTTDGPQRECPLHGDGITFVGQHRALQHENIELRRELEARRASVTTGGPAPAFTETWENGPSSRPPTAPPEPEVVQLPE